MPWCSECRQNCDVKQIGAFTDHWDDRREMHYTRGCTVEVSECCEAELNSGEAPEDNCDE